MLLFHDEGLASSVGCDERQGVLQPCPGDTISLVNLNIGHGRGNSLNQVFLGTSTISANLARIAALLEKNNAGLVALQEADRPSWWSGNIDHVRWLSNRLSYPEAIHSTHSSSILFDFGTAILSKFPVREIIHHAFSPSPPTLRKGFTLSRIRWPYQEAGSSSVTPVDIDVVSVHLDFSRESVRTSQVRELVGKLANRNNPLILMGDFNVEWSDVGELLPKLARDLGLKAYRPEAVSMGTFPSNGRRLDWILVSPEFSFVEYNVLPDIVSDHLAIGAVVAFRPIAK